MRALNHIRVISGCDCRRGRRGRDDHQQPAPPGRRCLRRIQVWPATFTIERAAAGGLAPGRCVAPTRRNHTARWCIRLIAVLATISRYGVAGASPFALTSRIGAIAGGLASGSYRLTARASAGGKVGELGAVSFRVVR